MRFTILLLLHYTFLTVLVLFVILVWSKNIQDSKLKLFRKYFVHEPVEVTQQETFPTHNVKTEKHQEKKKKRLPRCKWT